MAIEMGEVTGRSFSLEPSLEKRWFLQFFICIFICLSNGSTYCFGLFSPYMKTAPFNFNQSEINTISTICSLVASFSLPGGFIFDYKGPKFALLCGAIISLIGWVGMYLIFFSDTNPFMGTTIWPICLFYSAVYFGATFYDTGSVFTNLDAFSCYQGRVVLIQKTFLGLGSSVITQLYMSFFQARFSGIAPFFLFLLIYSVSVGILGTLFVRLPTKATRCLGLNVLDADQRRRGGESSMFDIPFNVGTIVLFVNIVFFLAVTILEQFVDLTEGVRTGLGVLSIIVCLSFFLMIFVSPSYAVNVGGYVSPPSTPVVDDSGEGIETEFSRLASTYADEVGAPERVGGKKTAEEEDEDDRPAVNPLRATADAPVRAAFSSTVDPVRQDEFVAEENGVFGTGLVLNGKSLWYNLRHLDFWLMWFVCFAGWSSATVVSNNSSQIYQALDFDGYSPTMNAVFVSIYGVASALGRVLVGAVHPVIQRHKVPVSYILVGVPILDVIGLLLFLVLPSMALSVCFFFIGLGTGFRWSTMVLMIKELFEPRNCGKHYTALYGAGMISPLIFNLGLFGPLYDHFSKKQGRYESRLCAGLECIWIPLAICAVVNAFAVPCAFWFAMRVRKNNGIR